MSSEESPVHFKPSNSTTKAKPHGVHGARSAWAILDEEPDHIDDLVNRDVDTRTPFTLDFDQAGRGKTVYFTAAWEMNNGREYRYRRFRALRSK
jgi:hypothetical protein